MPVVYHVQSGSVTQGEAEAARDALLEAMTKLGVPSETEVALVLTDDTDLQRLNSLYRGVDAPTDVLSFPADRAHVPDDEPPFLGDILISVDRACASASDAGRALGGELCLLAVHGLLHLLGHEDDTDQGAQDMHDLEVRLGVRQDGD